MVGRSGENEIIVDQPSKKASLFASGIVCSFTKKKRGAHETLGIDVLRYHFFVGTC